MSAVPPVLKRSKSSPSTVTEEPRNARQEAPVETPPIQKKISNHKTINNFKNPPIFTYICVQDFFSFYTSPVKYRTQGLREGLSSHLREDERWSI